jgi:hypothetical protein
MNITFEQADCVEQQAATLDQTQPSFYLTLGTTKLKTLELTFSEHLLC